MRKLCTLLLVSGLGLLSGCMVVSSKGTIAGPAGWRQAVAIDGKLYIVDVHSGKVSRIEPKAIDEAEVYVGSTSTKVDVIVIED